MRALVHFMIASLLAALAAGRIRPGWRGLGGELDRLGPGPLPCRQCLRPARPGFAFPAPETGARDQTFRLIVRPDIWGPSGAPAPVERVRPQAGNLRRRLRRTANSGPALVPGTTAGEFRRQEPSVTIPPGASVWSDAVACRSHPTSLALAGRKLAVSLHVAGESGPMTWHAKALTTSYLTRPEPARKGRRRTKPRSPSLRLPGFSSTRSI